MKAIIFSSTLTILILICIGLTAQEKLHYYEESLPIGMTPEEMTRLDEIGINHVRSAPPPAPIRNCAEWEPSTGVIIRYPLGIPYSLVKEMAEDIMVTTIVSSSSYQSQATTNYTNQGINMANCDFIIASTNSWWTRDYGPWFIFDGTDSLAIVDPIYNRPRPLDDVIPGQIGTEWGLNVYGMDLTTPGGNHMSNGLGTSMSTELVYNENSIADYQVDSIMYDFLNNDYDVLDYIESGGIHHIDCWAKFLNPNTILVKDVPTGSSSYALLNARANYLSQQIGPWGQPYTIVRIYCPYGTAYTNSIILNDKVLVPTFSNSYDGDALQTYADAMPGYEIIGFDGSWYDDDAIHCRTMGVPDRGMLFINHTPQTIVPGDGSDVEIGVKIKAHSGYGLISDSLKVFYRSKSPTYDYVNLVSTAQPDSFVAYIPAEDPGIVISYYIQAGDLSGRVETHPFIGAPWAHQYRVNSSPEITSLDTLYCDVNEAIAYYPDYNDPDDTALVVSYSNYPGWLAIQNDSLIGVAPSTPGNHEFTVSVSDPFSETEQAVTISVTEPFICGDANGDATVNILDVTFLISYLYAEGPPPPVMNAADVDMSGAVNIIDITTIINYLYLEGPPPTCF